MADAATLTDAIPDHKGDHYHEILRRIHTMLKPKTYLEIGSRSGTSLALSACPSIAIDPVFKLGRNYLGQKPACLLFQLPSDTFFDSYSPTAIFSRPIDFAFLDGLHLAEFLLRDFINTEKHCRRNSIVAFHDCLPLDIEMTRRHENGPGVRRSPRHPEWWTGDVWKVVLLLQRHRPDLTITCVDAAPTGLVFVTGLDPASTVLERSYFDLVKEIHAISDRDFRSFFESVEIVSTKTMATFEDMSKYFYL
ncbi:class I SAM-dependent methyltransferase [Methylorubrum sp. SB2]|uniref:class I SAM-dependent methyltransferase n=1 Tax=Methylorubrum subtropicum TaxID=3138812 RepID=UPI00313B16C4